MLQVRVGLRRRVRYLTRPASAVLVAFASACTHGVTAPSDAASQPGAGAPLVFRASPLDESEIRFIVPLGNLNPPGHTFPSDHIYFYNRIPNTPFPGAVPVYAPGDGRVQFILQSGVESQVGVRTGICIYYLDHIVLDPSVQIGVTLTAGQRIGVTGSVAYGIDLGVINEQKTVYFVNPLLFPGTSVHGDAPLTYYEEPLRSRMYGRVQAVGSNLDGPAWRYVLR